MTKMIFLLLFLPFFFTNPYRDDISIGVGRGGAGPGLKPPIFYISVNIM